MQAFVDVESLACRRCRATAIEQSARRLRPTGSGRSATVSHGDGTPDELPGAGTFTVQCALRLAPMFFVRPGELRRAEWKHFDLKKGEWRYLVTKTNTEHLVPLAAQAVAILRDLHALTGQRRHVLPGRDPKKPMSDAAVNAALRRMGYDTRTEITGHGFRAMARTILHQELGIAPEVIEHQLAHRVPDVPGTAFNRTKFVKERHRMMQQWADYLDKLKAGATVISLHGQAASLESRTA